MVYKKDENYYPKVCVEKYNSNNSYNVDSDEEYFDNSYDLYENATKKIQINEIIKLNV